jgi:prepilin-type N-terminal cleavage/methylation domain-containing protein
MNYNKYNKPLKRQSGYTLIEMMLVVSLMAIMTVLSFESKQHELEISKAKIVGGNLLQYNNAVRSWISTNAGAPNSIKYGSLWLKHTSCGGESSVQYLPCAFDNATVSDPISFGTLSLTSVITTTGTPPNQITSVTTTTSPFLYPATQVRSDLSGVAAIVAASGMTGYDTPVVMSTGSSYRSSPFSGIITMTSSNNPSTDAWLRTDGSNTMNNNITFNSTRPAITREIRNISRLQAFATETLYLGALGAGLLGNSVVVDSKLDVLEDILARKNLIVTGRTTTNDINLAGTVVAGSACAPSGLLSRDVRGMAISCESGIWVYPGMPGQYSYFNLSACPAGWTEANGLAGTVDLRGTFIRAADRGRGLDPSRSIGSYQGDDNRSHAHAATSSSEGSHGHAASTDQQGLHGHTGSTSVDGVHNHSMSFLRDRSSGALGNAVYGDESYYGQDTKTTSSEGAHGHNLNINAAGQHAHNVFIAANGVHTHVIGIAASGGAESRPKNVALLSCMKI